jgi:ATP-dependent protease ClpP protease subunit
MKQAYYFDAEFIEEEIHKVIAFFNSLQEGDEIDFYLHSPGGYNHVMETIKRILETSKFPITLIAAGEIQSAAFLLFYFANLNKIMLPNTVAMVHTMTKEYEDRDIRQNSDYYKKSKKHLDAMNEKVIDIFKEYNLLSPQEMEDYINGEDILILTDDLDAVMQNCPYGNYF